MANLMFSTHHGTSFFSFYRIISKEDVVPDWSFYLIHSEE